ncbi:MAG TPA: SHOCT domain-containing protein [Nitrosopumilus sp.]|nr:SHOCT domain-containing protein [Thermoproteota archaeon]HJJ22757.1 SHOCT domain-containing protein [Nitrosopumilus sp.]
MNRYRSYSLGMILLLMLLTSIPAFAEVTSLQTDYDSFYKGGKMKISGTVEEGTNGLVSIVIRDLDDEFVMLIQTLIDYDDSFEKTIKISDKFSKHGIYNATGFILNMTKGITTNFGVSLNGVPIILKEPPIEEVPIEETVVEEVPIEETEMQDTTTATIASFVDPSKDPQHYIDRYNNESIYKNWFDTNYPDLTIEEAVGYTDNISELKTTVQELIDKEIIPEAEATSIVMPTPQSNNNLEIMQISLVVVGIMALFGAIYGVKRKGDDNSKRISINKETIRQKIIRPIIGSNPKDILQTRLARGEITIEEYDKIKLKLY